MDFIGERRTRHEEKHNIYSYDSRSAGCFAVRLPVGRRNGGRGSGSGTRENVSEPAAGTAQEPVPESKVNQEMEEDAQGKQETQGQQEQGVNQVPKSQGQVSGLPYQFASKYGIIQSEYPVYELDAVVESKLPQRKRPYP